MPKRCGLQLILNSRCARRNIQASPSAKKRGLPVHTMDKLAQALPEDGRAQQLAIVRNAHEETLREHGHGPAVDPGKTYVDLIMKGIEFLLAELFNTGQKNWTPLGWRKRRGGLGGAQGW